MQLRNRMFLVALLSLPGLAIAQEGLSAVADEVLSVGTTNMAILGVGASPQVEALSAQMQESLARNSEWLTSYLDEHADLQPGEILPYHENFGITQEEYESLIQGFDDLEVIELIEVPLQVAREEGGYRLSSPPIEELGGVFIDIEEFGARTRFGIIDDCEVVLPNQENAGIGRWRGLTCRREEGNPLADNYAMNLVFSIGRVVETQEFYVHFVVQEVEAGALTMNFDLNMREVSSP